MNSSIPHASFLRALATPSTLQGIIDTSYFPQNIPPMLILALSLLSIFLETLDDLPHLQLALVNLDHHFRPSIHIDVLVAKDVSNRKD